MKNKFISLLILILLILSIAACNIAEPAMFTGGPIESFTVETDTNNSPDSSLSESVPTSRPAYEVIEGRTARHKETKAPGAVSEAALHQELEAAYGFDLETGDFSVKEFTAFYKKNGYKGLPNNRDAYVLNIMTNIKKLFPAIPSDIVSYMDRAANLKIIVDIDGGEGADGIYYPGMNEIYLIYEGKAVIHEYGHMLHYAVMGVTGQDGFGRQWTALNGGLSYNGGRGGKAVYNYETGKGASGSVFYGNYATTNIFEDVAETFWMMIERPNDLEKLIAAGAPLAKKAALLNSLLRDTLLKADAAVVTSAFEKYATDEFWDEDWDNAEDSGYEEDSYGEEDWYDTDWWCGDVDEYDQDGDGYCDDCGEWLDVSAYSGGSNYDDDEYDQDGDGYCDDCGESVGQQ